MHPLSFKSLLNSLVALEIAPESPRFGKGKYILPPVLILTPRLFCPIDIRLSLPDNYQLCIDVNAVEG